MASGFKLLGPICLLDMVRLVRRPRHFLLRGIFLSLLLAGLGCVWLSWSRGRLSYGRLGFEELASLAEDFFTAYMVVQFGIVVLLTPAYVGGAIAEEKHRQTLEFLLISDLTDREIVLGKLTARLAYLVLFILAGLPVLCLLQLFGGVDPGLLLASFATLLLTMLSMAALALLFSVYARKPGSAILWTWMALFVYLGLSAIVFLLAVLPPAPNFLAIPARAFYAGNILVAFGQWRDSLGQPVNVLPVLVRDYALFHVSVTLLCVVWAVLRMRAVACKEAGVSKRKAAGLRLVGRLPLGTQPMLWKELFASGRHSGWLARIFFWLLVIASFVPFGFILYDYRHSASGWFDRGEAVNIWLRVVGTAVACLGWLTVAVRSASTISGEREAQTLDSLLTAPLESSEILFAKGVGSILSIRWSALWLASIWLFGIFTGGLQMLAVPLLIGSWLIYAAFFSVLGLWFSLVCRTTARAIFWTLATSLFVGGGHWLVCGFCGAMCLLSGSGRGIENVAAIGLGQTPPFVVGLLAFQGQELSKTWQPELEKFVGATILGLVTWSVAAAILAAVVYARFQKTFIREASRDPDAYHPGKIVLAGGSWRDVSKDDDRQGDVPGNGTQ